jgi:hypothetical protein
MTDEAVKIYSRGSMLCLQDASFSEFLRKNVTGVFLQKNREFMYMLPIGHTKDAQVF